MTRLTRLSASSLLLGLSFLGGASAAHATQCSTGSESVLQTSLLTQFGSGPEGNCGVDPSNPGEWGQHDEEGPPHTNPPPIWNPPHDTWHDPHDGKDCNPSVVPLPPSSLLLISGALALLILGRRRRPATA